MFVCVLCLYCLCVNTCMCLCVFICVCACTYIFKEEVVMNLEEGENTGGVAEERRRNGNGVNTVFIYKNLKTF